MNIVLVFSVFSWLWYLLNKYIINSICVILSCSNFGNVLQPDFEHDDVIEWRHFLHYWPFVRGIHRSPVDSPHKSQWHFNVSFDVCLNKPFSKPSRCWRFETPWCALWHHCLRMSILLMPELEYCGITTSRGNASQTRSFEELIWFIYKVYTYLSLTIHKRAHQCL